MPDSTAVDRRAASTRATGPSTRTTRSSTPPSSTRCHAAGLAVNVWTVDDPDRMVELVALGVDGIVTNVPDVALRVLGRT